MSAVPDRWSSTRTVARVYVIAAVLGAAVGVVSALFLWAAKSLEHLMWQRVPTAIPWLGEHDRLATVLTCTAGGVLVGLVNRGTSPLLHEAEGVHDLDAALAATAGPPPRPAGLLRLAALGIVSLGFGAALGPEAPLIAVVAGLVGPLQGALRLARDEAVQLSISAALGGLFGAPLGAVALPVEGAGAGVASSRFARVGPSAVAAITGLWVLLAILPDGSLHHFSVDVRVVPELGSGLGWCAVAALVGALGGRLMHQSLVPAQRGAARLVRPLVPRAALGGLALGLCGAASPLALFSGHHGIQELLDGDRGAGALVGLAALKMVAVIACLATGWFGGEIFPIAFVGSALGLAVAIIVGTDATAAAAAAGMVAAAAVLMRRPVAALLVFVFFLPPGTLVAAALGAAIGAAVMPRPPAPTTAPD